MENTPDEKGNNEVKRLATETVDENVKSLTSPNSTDSKTQKPVMATSPKNKDNPSKIPALRGKPNQNKINSPKSGILGNTTRKNISNISLIKSANTKLNEEAKQTISETSLPLKTNSIKTSPPKKSFDSARTQITIPDRAGSNISHRSISNIANARKNEPGKLRKITSMAGDQYKLDMWENKVTEAQSVFIRQVEGLKTNKHRCEKFEKEYKFIGIKLHDGWKLMIKDDHLKKMPHKLPASSVGDFKEKIKENLSQHFEGIFNEVPENPDERNRKLEEFETVTFKEIFKMVDELTSTDITADSKQLEKLQKELKESKQLLKEHQEKQTKLEKQNKQKDLEELGKKDETIMELETKLKMLLKQHEDLKREFVEKTQLEEELQASKESYTVIEEKLLANEQQLNNAQKDLETKNELIKKMEDDIIKVYNEINVIKAKGSDEDKSKEEYIMKISDFESKISLLQNEKTTMEKQLKKFEEDYASVNDARLKLSIAENQIEILKKKLTENEQQQSQVDHPESVKELQQEIVKVRQADAEKKRELDTLKLELARAMCNIENLKAHIDNDQKMLEVRSDLINSLQANEKTLRKQLEGLFAQVGEKNAQLTGLSNELRTKSNGYQELCDAVTTKQKELSRQAHMIKLLEDSNERNNLLRIKQEQKINKMEEDVSHLKQTISIYQSNILCPSPKLDHQPVIDSSNEDHNNNFYYYINKRKRKRQIDINVKKYEA